MASHVGVANLLSMDAIRTCGRHGYFVDDRCPRCDTRGRLVIDGDRRRRLSKFVSGALRHFPDDVGLALDDGGWTSDAALVETVTGRYDWATPGHVEAVIEADPKGRFERDGDRVRAAYGHSIDVTLADTEERVPDRLYHGTDPTNRRRIHEEGLRPMGRQQVHLSSSIADAREVGRRHAADPIVFVVDAAALLCDGCDISKRGYATYTTEAVPPTYLSEWDGSDDA